MAGPFNFVSTILDAHLPPGADWRRHAEECLGRRGLALQGEDIRSGDAFVGWGRLYEPGEAEASFGQQPWFSMAERGEFRGRTLGFFTWEHYGASEKPFDDLAVFDFRGTIGRIDNGEAREAIVEKRYRLDNLLAKYGFDDGAGLLVLPGTAYDDAMAKRIEEALERAGHPAALGVGIARDITAHNPIVLGGGLLQDPATGADVKATPEILARIEVDILSYNLDLVTGRESEFWRWP